MSPVLTQHVSQPITLDEQTQKMKQHLLQDIRRSAYVYRVDCGVCNACESLVIHRKIAEEFLPLLNRNFCRHHTSIRRRTFWH